MSRSLRFYGILVAAAIALTGLAVQSTAQHVSTVVRVEGTDDGLIWD
ncbi:hypothetical protein [Streptomyces sp. NPDC057623]